jgi:hypothetical protein
MEKQIMRVKGREGRAMKGHWPLQNERGSVLLFMLGTLFFLLVFGGFAIDLSFLSTTKGELQRSMDAAALAGAGQLGFDDSTFPAVRQEAGRFGDLNPARVGAVNLALNPANDPNGDITLGVWDGANFTPSLDGSQVNAVRAQYATEVPTAFLRILGFNTLPVSARAIAVANPAANPPANACVIPIGVSGCGFEGGGGFNSQGCGEPISFISSSGGGPGGPPPGTNTAAWMNFQPALPDCDPVVDPTCQDFPWKDYLTAAINDMADNSCGTSTASVGNVTATNNGMIQNVLNTLETAFLDNYNSVNPITVTNADGDMVYQGGGWDLTAAVIQTSCPPGAISGDYNIIGWTRFVMTQVINKGECAVQNQYPGNEWDPLCPPPNGTGDSTTLPSNPNSFRAIFGYFSCGLMKSRPTSDPAPRSSIATGRKLVQ